MKAAAFLVINGPNLNLTGSREKDVYGSETLDEINAGITASAETLGASVYFFQSNHEGDIIDRIQTASEFYNGIIINAGALSHYSYAIRDAISACEIPCVEVHMSNIHALESFRNNSVISAVCKGTVSGFGAFGYHLVLAALVESIKA